MKTNTSLLVAIAWVLGMAALVLGMRTLLSGSEVRAADAEWMANVSNGRFANALASSGDGPDSWTPPRPGEPCVVQVDVSGGASLTWCLQVKAAPDAPYAVVATGTGDQNFVTTAWPYMNLTVSSYSSGTVSAWGVQGTR